MMARAVLLIVLGMVLGAIAWRTLAPQPDDLPVVHRSLDSFKPATAPASDGMISGRAVIVDGDTLHIGAAKIRLEGIDAPEADQVCLTAAGARWSCGESADAALRAAIGSAMVSCTPTGRDVYGRMLAICYADGAELNARLVRDGWALSFVRYGDRYRREEEEAKASQRELWAGAFIAPWDWRHRNSRTEILGAYQVPANAQRLLLPSP